MASVEVDLDPLDLVRAGAGAFGASAYFASPAGTPGAGWASPGRRPPRGPERFAALDAALREGLPAGAEAFIGFSFAAEGPGLARVGGLPRSGGAAAPDRRRAAGRAPPG